MGTQSFIIGARGSPLSRRQVDEALRILGGVFDNASFEPRWFDSPGDRDQETPLTNDDIPDDFFTRDIDQALLQKELDLAVHSAKDLPEVLPDDLTVAAMLPAGDIRDALVLPVNWPEDQTPSTIGTSSPRRKEQVQNLYPQAKPVPIRGDIGSRLEKLDAGKVDALIVAACALERLGLQSRINQYLNYDPAPLQGRLALVTRNDDPRLLPGLKQLDIRRTAGLVAIVGCPVDSSLVSHRAERYIQKADVIIHDRLVPDDLLLAVREKAIPVGKIGRETSTPQSEIHRIMLTEAEQGKLVVRLQGGEPGLFGHLAEEINFLTAWGIRVDIVPAITAAQVAAAKSHAALTQREGRGRFCFVSGYTSKDRDTPPLPGPETGNLAVYMAVLSREDLYHRLIDAGWPDDTAVVVAERLGYKDEYTHHTTINELSDLEIERPAVYLVGMEPCSPTPATLFVGTDPEHFLNHGPLIEWPLIQLVRKPMEERIQAILQFLAEVRGILFPSRFAVHAFMEAVMEWSDVRSLKEKLILAVGPSTAKELAGYGIKADGSAKNFGGVKSLAGELTPDFKGTYLYPCSDAAPRQARIDSMREHGIKLVPKVFYTNRTVPFKKLPRQPFNRVLFTSTSTVKVYFELYKEELMADRTWLAVGPSTHQALETLGLDAEVI